MKVLNPALIETRRAKALAAWRESEALNGAVVIGAGQLLGLPGGQDQTYAFRVHPDYQWLTGRRGHGGVLAYHSNEGWLDFVAEVTEAERVWEGREPMSEENTRPLSALREWLQQRGAGPIAALGAPMPGVQVDHERSARLAAWLLHARRVKDAAEIAVMRQAIAATVRGFAAAREATRPGATERDVQIELEAAMFRAGADDVGYATLVGSGPNSSVLHFAPGRRVIEADDLVLIDAGGAIDGYTADVTRTFAASGSLSSERQALYDTVLAAQVRAVDVCRSGVQWRAVHTSAAIDLATGLIDMGVLRGSAASIVEREAIALFFPHGVGHMVGLGVRDAGGRLPRAANAPRNDPGKEKCCGITLRVDLPIEAGYVMTVEPGLYFIPALLRDPARRERFADCVDWSRVDHLLALGIGGVRIEDNLLITTGAPDVMTAAIPK
ncbi:MAG: M24 family metallopeptidase [Phycisphaerae bacterium]|nr:M24 family metallopeptidase [Phycisphaerae bacterium]